VIQLDPPPSPRPKKESSTQDFKRRGKKILDSFAKRGCPSEFRSSGGLAILRGETEEESCSEGKKTQEALSTKDWDQSSKRL